MRLERLSYCFEEPMLRKVALRARQTPRYFRDCRRLILAIRAPFVLALFYCPIFAQNIDYEAFIAILTLSSIYRAGYG